MIAEISRPRRGQSIRLFLVDGTASGLISATIPNWTGSIVVGRSVQLPELLTRPEAHRPGCYILQGEDDSHPFGVRAYIGQASRLQDRLQKHAREKDFWNTAALISTFDTNFTAGHFLALESRLIQIANENGRAAIENKINPHENAGNLGEADQADMENFLDQLKLVLPVLGFNLLKESLAKKIIQPQDAVGEPNEVLELRHRSGIHARALIRDDEFIVLKGSTATKEKIGRYNGYAALRQALIDRRVLVDSSAGYLVFAQDTAFSSSSAAAAVILNRQASGPKEWKLAARGISLGAWEQEQAEFLREDEQP